MCDSRNPDSPFWWFNKTSREYLKSDWNSCFFRNQVTRAIDPVNINQSHICWGAPPFATTCCFVHIGHLAQAVQLHPEGPRIIKIRSGLYGGIMVVHDPFLKVWFHFDWYVKAGSIEQPWTLLKYQLHHLRPRLKRENLEKNNSWMGAESFSSYQEENHMIYNCGAKYWL